MTPANCDAPMSEPSEKPDKPTVAATLNLLRPAVRAMPAYMPGEQIPDLVKLNTNEGAYPPSPRVMAALAAIADESLRLYPDPVSSRLRAAAARALRRARRVHPRGQRLRRLPDHAVSRLPRRRRARRLPVADLRPLRHARVDAGRGAGARPVPVSGRRWQLPPELGAPGREADRARQPEQPVGDAGAGRRAARAVRRGGGRHRRRRRGVRRLRAGRGRRRQHAAATWTQHPNLVVLRTFSKSYSLAGARLGLLFAAAPIVEALNKVKDSYNVNAITQAIGVAALEDRADHEQAVRRTLDERARLERELAALGCQLARVGGQLPAVRDRPARRGGLPGAEAAGAAGALVARRPS